MVTANTPPWINFDLKSTLQVDSNPTIIFPQRLNNSILDTLMMNNTTEYPLFIDIQVVRDSSPPLFLARQRHIEAFTAVDLLKETCLYLNPGDYLVAYSNHRLHLLDCFISYREIISGTSSSLPISSLTSVSNPVTSLSSDDSIVTVVTTTAHNLLAGMIVQVSGAYPDTFNGLYQIISVPNETSFVYSTLNTKNPSGTASATTLPTLYSAILTVNQGHNLATGSVQNILVSGTNPNSYNGFYKAFVTSSTNIACPLKSPLTVDGIINPAAPPILQYLS